LNVLLGELLAGEQSIGNLLQRSQHRRLILQDSLVARGLGLAIARPQLAPVEGGPR
jgi:hypothetical protein